MAITIYDRPANQKRDPKAKLPLTAEQIKAQQGFADKLHKVLTEGIADGSACAFLTPNKERTTMLVAATVPMAALTVELPDGDTVTTNNWALNINVAIPEVKEQEATADDAEPVEALTFEELRAQTRANRTAKKNAK